MVGIGAGAVVDFNIMTEIAPGADVEFALVGGGNPTVNSRVRIGRVSRELQFRDEADYTTEEDKRFSPEFGAWLDRHDVGYTCTTNLLVRDNALIGLCAIRSQSQEAMDTDDKERFKLLSRHAQSAVSAKLALERQAFAMLTGAMDRISAAVLICDRHGRVRSVSDAAAETFARDRWISLANGRVVTCVSELQSLFDTALAAACLAHADLTAAPPASIVLRDRKGIPLHIDITPAPRLHDLDFDPCAMVVLHLGRARSIRRAEWARSAFALTPTEATVLVHLLDGKAAAGIADAMAIGLGTVRTHLHRILSKSNSGSQLELIATLSQYF